MLRDRGRAVVMLTNVVDVLEEPEVQYNDKFAMIQIVLQWPQ